MRSVLRLVVVFACVLAGCDSEIPGKNAVPFTNTMAGAGGGAGGTGGDLSAAGAAAMAGVSGAISEGGIGGMSGATGAGTGGIGGANAGSGGGAMGGIGGLSGEGGVGGSTAMASCTGKPGMKRGMSNETVMAGGKLRSFVYYAPEDLDANVAVPLVIVPHGSTMSGKQMLEITRYNELADTEKFIAVFPDGVDGPGSLAPWNVGAGVCGAGALVAGAGDDQAFMDALIDFVKADQCIDEDHMFMTGFSMGGYFSHESGCQRSDIRAIGPHSGGTHELSACPELHKPVIIFHFTSDSLIAYDCATDARDKWVARNGCSPASPDVRMVNGGTCEYYKACPDDGQVALCSFEEPPGGAGELPTGHAWSGGSQDGENALAAIPSTESATALGWAFFKEFAW